VGVEGMLETWVVIADSNLPERDRKMLSALVSREKQERISRFRHVRDAQSTLLGDLLIRSELCARTGLRNSELEFSINPYGKPFLKGYPHIHFNISHTAGYIACAIDNEPVGIDIEQVKTVYHDIADRFFAEDEKQYIYSGQEGPERFFEVWTKKESYIKREGKGLSIPLPSFSVFEIAKTKEIFFHPVFSNSEVLCHVCSRRQDFLPCHVIDCHAGNIVGHFLEMLDLVQ
jgi:4'-phosphopantetheinyl transferase